MNGLTEARVALTVTRNTPAANAAPMTQKHSRSSRLQSAIVASPIRFEFGARNATAARTRHPARPLFVYKPAFQKSESIEDTLVRVGLNIASSMRAAPLNVWAR